MQCPSHSLLGAEDALTTHLWVLGVPWHPADGEADPALTPAQGPTCTLLRFQTPEKPPPSLPGHPWAGRSRVLSGSRGAGYIKANWEGRSRLTLPQGCIWEPAQGGREESRLCRPSWATL